MRRDPFEVLTAIAKADFERERAVLLGLQTERDDLAARHDAARGHVGAALTAAGTGAHVAFYGNLAEGGRVRARAIAADLADLDARIADQGTVVRATRTEHKRAEALCDRRRDAERDRAERALALQQDEMAVLRHAWRRR